MLFLLGYSPGDRDNNPAAIVCYLAIKRWRPLLAILPLYSPCCFSSNAQETFFSTRGICLLHRIIWATPALHSLLKMRGAGHGDKEWRHPSYSAIKAAWCSSTVIRWFVRNNRGGMTGGLGSRQEEYFSWSSIKQKWRNKRKKITFLLVRNNYSVVPHFKVYSGWASQVIRQINIWFECSRKTYTFLKMILFFPLWNPLPPHVRGCATTSSLGLFPHPWHHTMSSLSLQNAWSSTEEKKENTHTTPTSTSS